MSQILQSDPSFEGAGEVRALLRTYDWSNSPLGHPDGWPGPLRTAVSMVLDSSFPMFIGWGGELGFLYNDAYARILGGKHPAALGRPFQQIWAEIWPDIAPIIERALSGQSSYHEDLPLLVLRRGYLEQSYFTFSYSPLHDADGSVGGMYCTVIETTERVQAERRAAFELKLTDALLPLTSPQQVLETASALLGEQVQADRVIYAEVDPDAGTFEVPHQFSRPGMPVQRPGLRLDAFGPALVAAVRAGETVCVDDVRLDPRTAASVAAWEERGIGALLTVPLVKAGRLSGFLSLHSTAPWRWTESEVAFARSTAERTWAALETARAQAELRAERDRSRYLFDTIAEGFLVLDQDCTIRQMNPEGLRFCGVTAQQAIGSNLWALFPKARDSDAARLYRRVIDTRVAGIAEHCHQLPDGRIAWADLRAYPLQDGGIAVFFRDITDRKLAELKLREADQRKDEFLAMLAHELRNPLAPISAAAELLAIGKLDEEHVRRSSAIVARQVRHMTSLVDDLLDVSRVTRGLVTLARAPVTAHTIVDEAVEQVLPLVRGRKQQLSVTVQDEGITVLGDKARLVQVMANVLGNAAKYTPDGRRIDVHAGVCGGQLVLSVRDEGIGMEQELTARVFDLFAQAERSADRSLGGLGLGLALVKHLVELHGGSVSCSSPGLGQGSTFEIALPVLEGQAPAGPQGAPGKLRGQGALRLLAVDDNADAAQTLGMLLEACGHEVLVEHDSRRALARAREARPDACLLDIGLPEIDGNELARRLRADPATAGAALVAVTGYGQEQDRQRAFAAGFDHYLVKPVDMDKLAEVLAGIAGSPAVASAA
jgi:PAS domain S-box-containing protein